MSLSTYAEPAIPPMHGRRLAACRIPVAACRAGREADTVQRSLLRRPVLAAVSGRRVLRAQRVRRGTVARLRPQILPPRYSATGRSVRAVLSARIPAAPPPGTGTPACLALALPSSLRPQPQHASADPSRHIKEAAGSCPRPRSSLENQLAPDSRSHRAPAQRATCGVRRCLRCGLRCPLHGRRDRNAPIHGHTCALRASSSSSGAAGFCAFWVQVARSASFTSLFLFLVCLPKVFEYPSHGRLTELPGCVLSGRTQDVTSLHAALCCSSRPLNSATAKAVSCFGPGSVSAKRHTGACVTARGLSHALFLCGARDPASCSMRF